MSTIEKKKKKLIEDYIEAAKKYSLENQELEQKIKDIKITLNLNQNILYDYIIKSAGETDEVKNLVNQTKKKWEETQSYIEKKNYFEIKIARLQELIEDTPTKIRDEINDITFKNNKAQEEINEKDKIINKLKKELDKTRKNALFKVARTEVYVTDPTKYSLEAEQELTGLKSILTKVTPMHKQKKEDAEQLKQEVEELKIKMKKLIEKAYTIYTQMNSKKNGIIVGEKNKKEEIKHLLKSIEGYDLNADINDEDNKDESEDDDDDNISNNKDDSDDENKENKKKIKAKQKELDKLTEEYTKLKAESQEYEKKINEHKKVYKDIKNKMKNLKESVNNN